MFSKIKNWLEAVAMCARLINVEKERPSDKWSYGLWNKNHTILYLWHEGSIYQKAASDVDALETWPHFSLKHPGAVRVYKDTISIK